MKKLLIGILAMSAAIAFASTFTWTGNGDGTSWSDAENWQSEDEGATYPKANADIAVLCDGTTTITLSENIKINTLDLEKRNSTIKFIGSSEGDGIVSLTATTQIGLPKMGSTFILSNCKLECTNQAMVLHKDVLFRLEDGAEFKCQNITHLYDGRLEITDGSVFSCNQLQFDGFTSSILISNAKLECRNQLVMVQNSSSVKVRFEGKTPKMVFTANNGNPYFNGNNKNVYFEFSIPKGGYTEAPIQCPATSTASFMYKNNRTGSMGYFSVDAKSPCFSEAGAFDQPLVLWTSSHATPIDLSMITFMNGVYPEDEYFLLSADAAEPSFVKAADFSGTAKALGYRVHSVVRDDVLFVRSEPEGVVSYDSPSASHTAGEVISLSSPASTIINNRDYRLTGYTLFEYAPGSFRCEATTNFVGGVSSFDYTFQGKEAEIIWNYASFPIITTAAINDANGSVTVSGGGLTDPEMPLTFTAATTDEAFEFQYWYGDLPYEKRYENPLTFVPAESGSITAFFGRKEGERILANLGSSQTLKEFFASATWSGGVIPGTNDTAIVLSSATGVTDSNPNQKGKINVPSFFAVKDLVITNGMVGINVPTGNVNMGAKDSDYYGSKYYKPLTVVNKARLEPFGCDIFGDIILDSYNNTTENGGGMLYVGGLEQEANTRVHVYGSVHIINGGIVLGAGTKLDKSIFDPVMSNSGSQYHVDYPDTFELFRGNNYFRVDGDTILEKPTAKNYINEIHVSNDPRTGAAMWLDLQDVSIAEGAKISATIGGYNRVTVDGRQYSMCPGGTCNGDNKTGGSYGGRGGGQNSVGEYTTYFATYGYENAPIHPGSQIGGMTRAGGGTIRLDCTDLVLDGTLCTHGYPGSGNKGSGAGGGIFVICDTFTPGANSLISVRGGGWINDTNAGGGGGRAAIAIGLTSEQQEALVYSEAHTARDIAISPLSDVLGDRFTARGGPGSANRSEGEPGTGVYIVNTQGKKTLTVVGNPENIGSPEPAYGPGVYDQGAEISIQGPEGAYTRTDNRSRRSVVGYTITDGEGEVLVSSETTTGLWELNENATLTWDITKLEHQILIGANSDGTIITNQIGNGESAWQRDGSEVSLTAVPNSGCVFKGWYGEVDAEWITETEIDFVADVPRTIYALFESIEGGKNEWTGSGDGVSYTDEANWSLGRLPGVNDEVLIPEGANVSASLCAPIEVGTLTIESGATLTIERNLSDFSTFTQIAAEILPIDTLPVKAKINGDANISGTLTIGRKYSAYEMTLDVGGNLTVNAGGSANFYAGFKPLVWNNPALWAQGGGSVNVGGTLTVSGTLFSSCENLSGATVVFDVGNLTVSEGGLFSANGAGYQYTSIGGSNLGYMPQLGNIGGYAGGTHAGIGGYSWTHSPTLLTYGYPYAPYLPGSPGFNTTANVGGGVIRVNARNATLIQGTISARGVNSTGLNGGGAGGSIWITTKRFHTTATAYMTAQGGNGTTDKNGNCGSGGGGRIAITLRFRESQIESLYEDGSIADFRNIEVVDLTQDSVPGRLLSSQVNVEGGESARPDDTRAYRGKPGTAYFIIAPNPATKFIMR